MDAIIKQVCNCEIRTCKVCNNEVCPSELAYHRSQATLLSQSAKCDGEPINFNASRLADWQLANEIIRKTSELANSGLRCWTSELTDSGHKK